MSDLTLQILTPTVVAAVVSGCALIARELVAGRARRQQGRQQRDVQQHGVLLDQVQALWNENAQVRQREDQCKQRCRALEERCCELERCCAQLRRRLDRLGRLLGSERIRPSRRRGIEKAPE